MSFFHVSGFDESLGPLYEDEIRRFFFDQLGADMMKLYSIQVNFEGTKAFVEFAEKMPSETNRDRVIIRFCHGSSLNFLNVY